MNTPQFDLSAMLSTPQQTAVQQIPCNKLHPYHNHKFELYSGERLEDMVASIKENGVLSPIIVQPDGDGYEILIGHNRWNASKLAGLPNVPAIIKAGLTEDEITMVVTTGYGRENIGFGNSSVTEITCHAKGAHFLDPSARTVIDIGGQDSKVIRIDDSGAVVSFVMNDKCAAGTGRFLDMMARTMELSLDEMGELGLKWKSDVTISNMCTVFAESEVVSLVAQDTPPEDIIHGLNKSVAGKTVSLVKRVGGESGYIMNEVFKTIKGELYEKDVL